MKFEVNDDSNKYSIEINIAQIIKWASLGVVCAVTINKYEFDEFIIFVLMGGLGISAFEIIYKMFKDE